MTTKLKRKRTSPDSDTDLRDLDARLDNINSKIHPVTPYLLTIPTTTPYRLSYENHQRVWIKGTPFTLAEGELQYMSNFAERASTLIQAHGDWDDGKGGLSRRAKSPPSKSRTSTPQTAAKKIKLGEYTAKKASGKTPPSKPPPMAERAADKVMKHGTAASRQANRLNSKISSPKKRSRDEVEDSSDASSKVKNGQASGVAEKKPRPSSSLSEAKPTLPPPIMPLPPKLREALAEYKRRKEASEPLEVSEAEARPSMPPEPPDAPTPAASLQPSEPPESTEIPAAGLSRPSEPSEALDAPEAPEASTAKKSVGTSVGESSKDLLTANVPSSSDAASKRSVIIVLRFRKRRIDFQRLVKTTRSRPTAQSARAGSAARTALSSGRPSSSATTSPVHRQPSGDSRTSSPVTSRSSGKGLQSGYAELEKQWNKLAIKLKSLSQDKDFRKSNPKEAYVCFLSSVVGFFVQVGIKMYYLGPQDDSVRMVLDGIHGVIYRTRRGEHNPPADCEYLVGLLWHMEAVVCREQANLKRLASESIERHKAAVRCMDKSLDTMNNCTLEEEFPRTWMGRTTSTTGWREFDRSNLEPRNPFKGPYFMEGGTGTVVTAAREVRLMIVEWCEQHHVRYDDELGVLGGAKDA